MTRRIFPIVLLLVAAAAQAAPSQIVENASLMAPAELNSVTSLYNIEFARVADERLLLDLHLPATPGPHPVLLWLHTGAWVTGERGGGTALRQATRGYAVASIDYRLAPDWIFPAQLEDCKAAIRWLRANAAEYNLDPNRVGVIGASAGGHLAALLGTTAGIAELEGSYLGNPEFSSSVRAVVDFYGPTDLLKLREQALPCMGVDPNASWAPPSLFIGCPIQECPDKTSAANPMTYITPDDPPFLIIHGTADCLVPWQQSQLLHDALTAQGRSSTLHILQGAEHGGDAFETLQYRQVVDEFLDRTVKNGSRRVRAARR